MWIKKQIRKWRWKTWRWIIVVGITILALVGANILSQINNQETADLLKLLAENPIISWVGGLISTIIEIALVTIICGKYDISKIRDFKEQLDIPENFKEK